MGQPQAGEVWRFSADGELVGTFGREGRGPGEFQSISGIFSSGDSVIVADRTRNHVFHADTLVRTLGSVSVPDDERFTAQRLGRFADGRWLVVGVARLARNAGPPRPILVSRERGAAETIAMVAKNDSLRPGVDTRTRLTVYIDLPVNSGDLWAPFHQKGSGLAVLTRPIPDGPESATARLTLLNLEGDTVRTLRFTDRAAAPIPPEAYDGKVEVVVEGVLGGTPFSRAQVERAVNDGVIRYPYQPLFDRFLIGGEGTLWLGKGSFGLSERVWLLYDQEGNPLGRVELSSSDEILAVDGRRVWVLQHGEFDEPYIVRMRLRGTRLAPPAERHPSLR